MEIKQPESLQQVLESMARGEAVLKDNWKQQQKQADCKPASPVPSAVGPRKPTLLGRIRLEPKPRNSFTDLIMRVRQAIRL